MLSIVTPWLDHPELILGYEPAVRGAQVIVVDNGSQAHNSQMIAAMVERLGGVFIRNENNLGYAHANNQGLERATGEIVVFLNNDIEAGGDWQSIVAGVKRGSLYSPSMMMQYVAGVPIFYLEGWCLIGYTDEVWAIGAWNDKDFPGLYWEDNELCWRACRAGMGIKQIDLPLRHLSNYTTSRTPGAYEHSDANRAVFERMVIDAR